MMIHRQRSLSCLICATVAGKGRDLCGDTSVEYGTQTSKGREAAWLEQTVPWGINAWIRCPCDRSEVSNFTTLIGIPILCARARAFPRCSRILPYPSTAFKALQDRSRLISPCAIPRVNIGRISSVTKKDHWTTKAFCLVFLHLNLRFLASRTRQI